MSRKMAQLQEFPGIEAGGRNRSIPLGTTKTQYIVVKVSSQTQDIV